MSNITAIVNIYKRPHVLESQITAIRAQTIPPACIFIWNNGNKDVDLSAYKGASDIRVFDNNYNYGVWSRFLIGLLAPTEYICIFDDDTIPGNRWFENCLGAMSKKAALYGTIGVLFKDLDRYSHLKRYGWDGPCDRSMPVDIVGHSWFFRREWLGYFTREEPQVYTKISNGEDVHFSFMLQKYANIPTYVPPHPNSDISLWGSQPTTAWKYGTDGNSETGAHFPIDVMFKEYIARGFRTCIQRQTATSETDFQYFLQKIRTRQPFGILRPADGEFHVLQNNTLTNIDNWTFTNGGKLYRDLTDAIELAVNKCCYVGIPCETCNTSMAQWYYTRFQMNPLYTTFANIFVNKNWTPFVNFLQDEKIPFTFIGPSNKASPFLVQDFIQIPEFLVNNWDSEGDATIDRILSIISKKESHIFLFSAGPVAKILIAKAWALHPKNIYMDIGSCLDLYLKGSTNRHYTIAGDGLNTLVCNFSPSLITI